MIIYGGSKEQVEKQLECEHEWNGPCMDDKYRYFKCKKCFCVDRDTEECDEDVPGERLNVFVRGYFEVLQELDALCERRNEAVRDVEKKRKEIYALKEAREDELVHFREQTQKAGDNATKWLEEADAWIRVARGIFEMFEGFPLVKVTPTSLESFLVGIKLRLEKAEGRE